MKYEVPCSRCDKVFWYEMFGDHSKQRLRSKLKNWGWELNPNICLFCKNDEKVANEQRAIGT